MKRLPDWSSATPCGELSVTLGVDTTAPLPAAVIVTTRLLPESATYSVAEPSTVTPVGKLSPVLNPLIASTEVLPSGFIFTI